MKKVLVSLIAAVLIMVSFGRPASAASFFGKITLVQTTGTEGTLRFFINTPSALSLFATGVARDVLLAALTQKASVSVGYTPITCPGGITGACGNVTFVTLDQSGF